MVQKIFEERGLFWWHDDPVPENQFAPDSCIVGTISIEESGAVYLELDGYFASSEGGAAAGIVGQTERFPVEKAIQGKLKVSSRNVLLLGLRRHGWTLSINGISHERFAASHCLVANCSFPPATRPLRFSALEVDLTGLEEWLRLSNIEVKRNRQRISVKHRVPKADVHDLDDGTLTVRYEISGPWTGNFIRHMDKLSLSESVSLRFKPKRARTLVEMQDDYAWLQELFILLTGSTFSLAWPRLVIGKMACEYYYAGFERSTKAPTWDECWVSYLQVKHNFGSIVKALRNKRVEFGPGFYLYLGLRRNMKMYVEHRFVNLIWGLESLHRRKNRDKVKETKLDSKIQRILDQISGSNDRRWLEGQLKHTGEPSLKERLLEVFSVLPLGFERSRLEEFCKSCADRRNDISHFGGQREGRDNQEFMVDIVTKSEALSYLYHAVLLHEVGVDAMLIKENLLGTRPNVFRSKYAFHAVGLLSAAG